VDDPPQLGKTGKHLGPSSTRAAVLHQLTSGHQLYAGNDHEGGWLPQRLTARTAKTVEDANRRLTATETTAWRPPFQFNPNAKRRNAAQSHWQLRPNAQRWFTTKLG